MVRRISGAALAGLAVLALSACESIGEIASAVGEAAKATDTLLHETSGALTKVDKVTGRRSLNLDTKRHAYERGASTFAAVLSDPTKVGAQPGAKPLPATDPRYRRLERIFGRIVSASHAAEEAERPAEFALIDDPQWNALALGGNKTVFFTGLTASLNDDELAAVVGHELAHNTAAHISEHAAARIVSLATERGRKKGWSEAYTYKHEQEADDLGILYAALAGYDPYAAAALWEKKADSGYGWFRTHPTSAERVRRNRETAGKVRQYYRPGRVNPEAKAILGCNVLYCRSDRPSLNPGSGGGLLALAEAVRSIRQQYKDIKKEWKRQKEEIAQHDNRNDERYEDEWRSADGDRYVGEFVNGEFHGCGAYIWPDGEFYAGEFKNGKFHGLGSYAWPNGSAKTCDWRDDKEMPESCIKHRVDGPLPKQARAVCFRRAVWRDKLPLPVGRQGDTEPEIHSRRADEHYDGNYKSGRRHGRGILTFSNGDRYEGRFVDGEIRGKGVLYLANGDIYASDSDFGPRGLQGCGLFIGANGDRYMGQFRNSRFHGRGTYEWKNGRGATCDWRAGQSVEHSCIAHRAIGVGKRQNGDGVCGSLGDNNLLGMETRRLQRECRERFRGGKDRTAYRECRARARSVTLSELRGRKL